MFKTASKLRGAFASIAYRRPPASCLAVTLPFAGGGRRSTTQQRQKMIGGRAGPKGVSINGLGTQGLPAGERATELSYAPRFFTVVALGSSAVIPRRY